MNLTRCGISSATRTNWLQPGLAACLLAVVTLSPLNGEAAEDHSPEASLAAIQLADDELTVELVAHEPQVIDPVAARFDEHGRLWVVEMRDYPTGPSAGQEPNGRIVILTDEDNDGTFESATTFADKLLFPTGLQPWKGGVFVTLAGELAYLKDTDGDDICDTHETWFTGFAEDNEQLRANHPTLGPDGMIYVACGLRGGEIRDARVGHDQTVNVSVKGHDFRFDPRGDRFEAVAGNGQFGLTFDDFGRRFICMNARPLSHVVIEDDILGRNPLLADSTTVEHVIPGGQTEPVYPLVEQWTTSTFHKGSWTAACGVHVHRSSALGQPFDGNAFICEPTGALVHREILIDSGPTFESKPAYDKREFLASTDSWFRPVNLFDGPDGALYVVDMARREIEHPQWMPKEAVQRADFVSGNTLGRIYRVTAETSEHSTSNANLGQMSNSDLVTELLTTTNGWTRDTAFRLLLERGTAPTPPANRRIQTTVPGAVAQLELLGALGEFDEAVFASAISSDEPRIHDAALRVAVGSLPSEPKAMRNALFAAVESDDPKLRTRAAILLGYASADTATNALAKLAARDGDDPWSRRVILSSLRGREVDVASQIIAASDHPELIKATFQLATRASLEAPDKSMTLLKSVLSAEATDFVKRAALNGIAQAINKPKPETFFQTDATVFEQLIPTALTQLRSGDSDAAEFLGWYHPESTEWGGILREPIAIDALSTLIARLARRPDFPTDTEFLSSLGELRAPVRASVLNAIWSSPSRATTLLEAVRDGHLDSSLIDNTIADKLRKHRDKAVAELARDVLPQRNTNRLAVIEQYHPSLALDASSSNGQTMFKKHCGTCHRVGSDGGNVGPDLSDLRRKTPEQLLQAILDPNVAVDANYINHMALTADGRVISGLLVSDSQQAVTLRGTDARDVTVLRSDLESLTPTGQSIMPEGLERQLNQQAMADVIYYLKNWRYEQP